MHFDLTPFLTAEGLVALATLTALEIVLGIDNIVFISILTGKLPPEKQAAARRTGLFVAMFTRIGLLLFISFIMGLTRAIFEIPAILAMKEPMGISGKDLILILGGLFLIFKATKEIHHKLDGGESPAGEHPDPGRKLGRATFGATIFQIVLIDIVFSLDSVITAVGMAKHIEVMIAAVIIAVGAMLLAVGSVSRFVETHPTIKMLALSFLLLIGVVLVADGFHQHISKGYIYFAMAFSLVVEMLNLRVRKHKPAAPPHHP
jgi:predicted tellurium resistance membrane protein TerC